MVGRLAGPIAPDDRMVTAAGRYRDGPGRQKVGAMIGFARPVLRTVLLAPLAAAATALIALTAGLAASVTALVTLAATALIVPGTGVPNPQAVPGYMENAVGYYISPTTPVCATVCTAEPVPYAAQFWPFPFEGWGGLSGAKLDVSVTDGLSQLTSDLVGTYRPSDQNPVVVFGYSQGATVASRQKTLLSKLSAQDQEAVSFVLIGNPNRPNGGLFERLAAFGTVPILDATFGLPTPTDTAMATTDIAFEYDGVADFPLYPVNLLADLNAIAGFWYNHGTMLSPNGRNPAESPNGLSPAELAAAIADPANQQRLPGSDTTYVLVPTPNLPLLQPLREFGAFTGLQFITTPLIHLIQPALKVLIDTGYDRTLPYGRPAPFRLIPRVNPLTLTVDLAEAVGQGITDALRDITGASNRPSVPAPPAISTARASVATTAAVRPRRVAARPAAAGTGPGRTAAPTARPSTGPSERAAATQRVRRAPAP